MSEVYYYIGRSMLGLEILCLFFAFFILSKRKTSLVFKLFVGILILTVCTELYALVRYHILEIRNSNLLYNIFNFGAYTLWSLIFYNLIHSPNNRISVFGLLFYWSTLLVEGFFYLDYSVEIQSYGHIVGSIAILVNIVTFYIQILKSGKSENLFTNLFFWTSIGLLLYYVVNIPVRIVEEQFQELGTTIYVLYVAKCVLGLLMYVFFMIGLTYFYRYNEA